MELGAIIPEAGILPHLAATTREAVLTELAAPALALCPAVAEENLLDVLLAREALGSTAVGEGVAIPHGRLQRLSSPVLVVGRSQKGIPFAAPDNLDCKILFLLLTPEQGAGRHLRLLAQLARRARDPIFRFEFLRAEGSLQIRRLVTAP